MPNLRVQSLTTREKNPPGFFTDFGSTEKRKNRQKLLLKAFSSGRSVEYGLIMVKLYQHL